MNSKREVRAPWYRLIGTCLPVVLMLAVSFLGGGCGNGDGPVLARIGDHTITARDFEQLYARQTDDLELTEAEQRQQFLESLVHKELMVLAARDRGMFEDPAVIEQVEEFEDGFLRAEFDAREAAIDSTVSEKALASAFEQSQREILLRHLVVWSLAEGEEIRRRLDAGEDFGAVATEASIDPRAASNGGLFDWMSELQLIGPFRTALADLEVGDVGGPFASVYGIHLIRLEERRQREGADLEVEREGLIAQVQQMRLHDARMAMQNLLIERYKLQVNQEAVLATVAKAKAALEAVQTDSTAAVEPPPADERWNPEPAELEQVLATYEGGQITVGDYREGLLGRGFFLYRRLNPGAGLQDVRSIFYTRTMVLEARRRKLDQEPDIARRISVKREEIAVTELYNREILGGIEISDEEIKEFYEENTEHFQKEEQFRYAYLQVDDASVAEALVQELQDVSWEQFESLKTELGGEGQLVAGQRDTGYKNASRLPQEFTEVARGMEPKEVGHVVWPDGSHMVFVMIEHRPTRALTFEESREAAKNSVWNQRSEERLHALLDGLKERYPVEQYPDRL